MVFSINVLLELRGAPAFQQISNMAGTAWADDRFTSNFAILLASARRPATVLSHRVGGTILKVRRLAIVQKPLSRSYRSVQISKLRVLDR